MDGQLSRKKVIGSPIYEESLERTFVEGIERFGMFQARKYLEHILNTVEKLENDYPYYPECRHLTTKSRMYRNIIPRFTPYHLPHHRGTHRGAGHRPFSIQHAKDQENKEYPHRITSKKGKEPLVSDPPLFADI